VNKICKRQLKTSANPFSGDNDSDNEGEAKNEHTRMMEEGGFTIVQEETEGTKRGKATDGNTNTVQVVSREEAEDYYKMQQMKMDGTVTEGDKLNFANGKKKNQQLKTDFYKFQFKEDKQSKLEELRSGFEDDKRRLAKMMLKQKAKESKNAKTA
jgi:hypothetical protein